MMTTLAVPQPSPSSLWAKAVDELPDEHKHGIDFTNAEKIDILKDLRAKAEKSRDKFLVSRWKYTRKTGETVIMRDLFEKLVRWLDMFKQIGDVAVQYDAAHASLPWAGIRLVLQIVVNDTKKLEGAMEDLTWISELICRYTIVEGLYIYDASAAHKELENAVIKLYASILSHLSYITQYFGQGTAKRLIKSAGPSQTLDSSLENIRKSEQRVEKWRSLAESNDHIKQNNKLTDLLNTMNQPLKRIDQNLEKLADNLERSKRTAILQWLSPEPYLGHHKQVKEGLLKGTGKWLLDDPVFKKWRDDSASSILWLHGIAGSGKSKLVSIVIDEAMNNFQARNSPHPVFFYCSRNPAEPTRSNPRAILASIARQLSAAAPGKPLLKPTIEMYEREEDEGFVSGPPKMEEICELIMQLIEIYPQTTIVIDAMDECDPQKREELLHFLETILQNASSLVKIFVSSRNDQDIVYKLKSYPNLNIDSQANGKDIARFVEYEVERLIQQKKLLRHSQSPDQLKELIISTTIKGAHEMFRWASMQLQHLSLLTLDADIKNAIGRLPPDLRTLYNELYNTLSTTPGELRSTIFKNALHWLLSAQTTLEPEEFLTAVTLIPNEDQRVPATQEQILDICNNFIVYDSQLQTYRFAHLSVREFLEGRPEFNVPSSNRLLAETCLWNLLCMNPSPATQRFFREIGWKFEIEISVLAELGGYADLFWGTHCRLAGEMRKSGPLQAALEYLFLKENDGWSGLVSNEKDQRSDDSHKQNQLPESTIALWNARVGWIRDKTREVSLYRRLAVQRLVGTIDGIKARDLRRAKNPRVSLRLDSCRPSEYWPASTSLFIVCVHDLEEIGRELLVGEALTRPYVNLDGRSIFRVASNFGSCGVISHMVMQKEFTAVLAEEMMFFAGLQYDANVAKVLIKHWETDAQSRKALLMTALKECSPEAVEVLIDSWEEFPITQEVVQMVAKNTFYASELMTLLQQRNPEFRVTQKTIVEAIRYDFNSLTTVKLLFSHSKEDVKITQKMVAETVKHQAWPMELVKYLLEEGGAEVEVTEDLVIDALQQPYSKISMVKFLLDPVRTKIRITQRMIEAAIDSVFSNTEIINFLLDQGTDDIIITEDTVEIMRGRVGHTILMRSFLRKRRKDLPIATSVVTAMLKYLDIEILEILVDECGVEAVITMENIHVIAQHGYYAQRALMELFEKRPEVLDVLTRVTEEFRKQVNGQN